MATLTKKGKEARQALIKGINELSELVSLTLGPLGNNIAIAKRWGPPCVINDGVTNAKSIIPQNPFENMGAELVKEAASKTNDNAGDGSTTATILAASIVNEGNTKIEEGANPMILKKGIEEAVSIVVDEIKKQAKPITNKEETAAIASISAASPEIGKLIAEAIEKLGNNGVVTVEESAGLTTEVIYKEGMEFDKGY